MNVEPRPTRFRYTVLAMLVLMYAVSYIDRVCIAAVAPGIRAEFDLSPSQLGIVFTAFSVAYALFQIPGGRLADRFGPRRVLAGMGAFWGACTLLTAGAWNQASLLGARFLCGAGESGGFPTASRSIYQWLAPHERGFAQGITHSGARLAGAVTPPVAAWLMVHYGWRSAFIVFGLVTFVWVAAWYWLYRDSPGAHPRVNAQEMARIRAGSEMGGDSAGATRSWTSLLRDRNLLLLAGTHFCYVYTFWIFITWFPTYLMETRGVEVTTAGLLAALPLLAGAVTNTLGGWISDRIVARRGLRIGRAMVAACAFLACLAFIIPASLIEDFFWAIVFFVLAAAALESITGVSWAASVDIGRENSGLASGIMNTSGNIGGALSPAVFGLLVEQTGMWQLPFLVAAFFCLIAAVLWTRIRF